MCARWIIPVSASLGVHSSAVLAAAAWWWFTPARILLPGGAASSDTLVVSALVLEREGPASLRPAVNDPIPDQSAAPGMIPDRSEPAFEPQVLSFDAVGGASEPEPQTADESAAGRAESPAAASNPDESIGAVPGVRVMIEAMDEALDQATALARRALSAAGRGIRGTTAPPLVRAQPAADTSQGAEVAATAVSSAIGGVTSAPAAASGNRPPVYPAECRKRRQSGTVWLHASVDDDGRVIHAEVSRSSGVALLDASALKAASSWVFVPAMENGVPAASEVDFPVTFVLRP